jgi:hypothetical protein
MAFFAKADPAERQQRDLETKLKAKRAKSSVARLPKPAPLRIARKRSSWRPMAVTMRRCLPSRTRCAASWTASRP